MTLIEWANSGWLRSHKTSRQEIRDLLAIVERDLQDTREEAISADWRFGIAYNAALKLCTILLHAEGYRPEHASAHYRTLASLPLILGDARKDDADYLETCRGGLRVIYLHVPEAHRIYFVTIYGKDEKDDLGTEQKRQLRALAEQTREALRVKQRREGKD